MDAAVELHTRLASSTTAETVLLAATASLTAGPATDGLATQLQSQTTGGRSLSHVQELLATLALGG